MPRWVDSRRPKKSRTSSFFSALRRRAIARARPTASTAGGSAAQIEEIVVKQAVMIAPGEIEIREVAPPAPRPGEVLVRVRRIGLRRSDVHVNPGRHPYTTYPAIQGPAYPAPIDA